MKFDTISGTCTNIVDFFCEPWHFVLHLALDSGLSIPAPVCQRFREKMGNKLKEKKIKMLAMKPENAGNFKVNSATNPLALLKQLVHQ